MEQQQGGGEGLLCVLLHQVHQYLIQGVPQELHCPADGRPEEVPQRGAGEGHQGGHQGHSHQVLAVLGLPVWPKEHQLRGPVREARVQDQEHSKEVRREELIILTTILIIIITLILSNLIIIIFRPSKF